MVNKKINRFSKKFMNKKIKKYEILSHSPIKKILNKKKIILTHSVPNNIVKIKFRISKKSNKHENTITVILSEKKLTLSVPNRF